MGDHPFPFQPTLLSFQDMLNLDEDGWASSSNPYNISNFFSALSPSPTKSSWHKEPDSSSTVPRVLSFEADASQDSDPLVDIILDSIKGKDNNENCEATESTSEQVITTTKPELDDDFYQALDVFDNAVVQAEIRNAKSKDAHYIGQDGISSSPHSQTDDGIELIIPEVDLDYDEVNANRFQTPKKLDTSTVPKKSTPKSADPSTSNVLSPLKNLPRPTLVDAAKLVNVEERLKSESKKKLIDELENLISYLKCYSKTLGEFLKEEGDLILEQHNARLFVSDVLPEAKDNLLDRPLEMVHSITRTLVDQVKGQTPLSLLPKRRPYLWKGSELLALQEAVLQSVIARREFMLNCRYTELLTEMGFDSTDFAKLKTCDSPQTEKGLIKILINDHNFFSKLKSSGKSAIQKFVIREQHGKPGVPRVLWLPSPEELVDEKWKCLWKINNETMLSNIEEKDVDWLFVVKKVNEKLPHLKIDEETCRLTYNHFLSYKVNSLPWNMEELRQLRDIRFRYPKLSWSEIASFLKTNRTPFSCFVKYKTYCYSSTTSNPEALSIKAYRLIKNYLSEAQGDLSRLACRLSCLPRRQFQSWMKPSKLAHICRTHFNPRKKKGKISLEEDCLLLVVMEHYRDYLLKEEGMSEPLSYAMPWRNVTFWRVRFGALFTNFLYKKWTLEDDKLLLNLVAEHGRNYKVIQRSFPLKNRKQCRERYVRLQRILKHHTLEDYHLLYNCSKRNIHLNHLNEIVKHLESTIRSKRNGGDRFIRAADLEFMKLRRPPTDSNVETYLLTFPLDTMEMALARLTNTLLKIFEKVENYIRLTSNKLHLIPDNAVEESHQGKKLIGINRRQFNPSCPISVASALQIRNAELKSQIQFDDLTQFEEAVYRHHKYFSLKGKMKLCIKRCGIPSLDELRQLQSVSRIILPKRDVIPVKVMPYVKSQLPSIIFSGKDINASVKNENELLQEIEERKKGGRRKGSKRKRTAMREQKRMAAMKRWQNNPKKLEEEEYCEFENVHFEIDSEPQDDPISSSNLSDVKVDVDGDRGMEMRGTILGILSEHSYTVPMENPSTYSSYPHPKLFPIFGQVKEEVPDEVMEEPTDTSDYMTLANMKCDED